MEKFDPGDYRLTFSDVQEIQRLRKKFLKLQAILESHMDVAIGLEVHSNAIIAHDRHSSFAGRLSIYMTQLRSYSRSVSMLLEHSKGISKVVLSSYIWNLPEPYVL